MATVETWTGIEARALRLAKRMSLNAFAGHLGVSDSTLVRWEQRGASIVIRPVNQLALDSALQSSGPDVHQRFVAFTNGSTSVQSEHEAPAAVAADPQQQRHRGDGKLMALVPAGVFLSGPDDEPIHLPGYYIDVFPVTNTDYSRFVAATGHQAPEHWPGGRVPPAVADHPVVFVTWHDAMAYASWAGKELATAQQWEKAARGPRGHVYPWGSQPTPAKCNTRESGIGTTTPVGRFHSGVSPYGVYDMCGNTWEWCSTRSAPHRYELKAGAFTSPFGRAKPSLFNDASSVMLDDDTGFRCCAPENLPR